MNVIYFPLTHDARSKVPMKRTKTEPDVSAVLTTLDPSHPNYDAILLKRSRLEAHRRRRAENRGEVTQGGPSNVSKAPAKKRAPRTKT